MEGPEIVSLTLRTLQRQTFTKNCSMTRNELENLRHLLNELNKLQENLSYEYTEETAQYNHSTQQQHNNSGSRKRKHVHTSGISEDIRDSVRYLANTIIEADDNLRSSENVQTFTTSATPNHSKDASGNSRNTDFSVSSLLASQATSPPAERQNPPAKKLQKVRKPHKGAHIYSSNHPLNHYHHIHHFLLVIELISQ